MRSSCGRSRRAWHSSGIEVIVVALIHSYANQRTRSRNGAIPREACPDQPELVVDRSVPKRAKTSDFLTTIADAYVQLMMSAIRGASKRSAWTLPNNIMISSGTRPVHGSVDLFFECVWRKLGPAGSARSWPGPDRARAGRKPHLFDMGGTTARIVHPDQLLKGALRVDRQSRLQEGEWPARPDSRDPKWSRSGPAAARSRHALMPCNGASRPRECGRRARPRPSTACGGRQPHRDPDADLHRQDRW